MYMQAAGLGRFKFRRGLGMSCPGDPGCPGYVAPGSVDYQTSLLQEILANQQDGSAPVMGSPAPSSSGSFSSWLNQNAGTVAIGAGALFLFAMAVKR